MESSKKSDYPYGGAMYTEICDFKRKRLSTVVGCPEVASQLTALEQGWVTQLESLRSKYSTTKLDNTKVLIQRQPPGVPARLLLESDGQPWNERLLVSFQERAFYLYGKHKREKEFTLLQTESWNSEGCFSRIFEGSAFTIRQLSIGLFVVKYFLPLAVRFGR
jgi:hypothetical protein